MILSSGCSTCKPKIEYVDRTVMVERDIPVFPDTPPPSDSMLKVWGDYKLYKKACEVQLDKCNADKKAMRGGDE